MAIDVGRDPNVGVAKDALHGRWIRPEHHQQRSRRVAGVVEPERQDGLLNYYHREVA